MGWPGWATPPLAKSGPRGVWPGLRWVHMRFAFPVATGLLKSSLFTLWDCHVGARRKEGHECSLACSLCFKYVTVHICIAFYILRSFSAQFPLLPGILLACWPCILSSTQVETEAQIGCAFSLSPSKALWGVQGTSFILTLNRHINWSSGKLCFSPKAGWALNANVLIPIL